MFRPTRIARTAALALGLAALTGCASEQPAPEDPAVAEQEAVGAPAAETQQRPMAGFDFDHEARQDDPFNGDSGINAFAVQMPDDTYRWCYSYMVTGSYQGPQMPCEAAPEGWAPPAGWAVFEFDHEARQDDAFAGDSGLNAFVMTMPDGTYRWCFSYMVTGSYSDPALHEEVAPAGWKP